MKVGLVIFTNRLKELILNNIYTTKEKELRGRKKDTKTERVKNRFLLNSECQHFHWSMHSNLLTLHLYSSSVRSCSKKEEYCFVVDQFS